MNPSADMANNVAIVKNNAAPVKNNASTVIISTTTVLKTVLFTLRYGEDHDKPYRALHHCY
jgi:predicted secreted protein